MFKLKSGQQLILASASPRRRDLLEGVGLEFEVDCPHVDETPQQGELPEQMVRRLALAKARAIAPRHPHAWVIGADTTVVVDGEVLGKPVDKADAGRMLGQIQGRSHQVWGGIALIKSAAGIEHVEAHLSEVDIVALNAGRIERYIATGEPLDKAGSYAIQGVGAGLVNRVEGSYTNVVGLNLAALLGALLERGVIE